MRDDDVSELAGVLRDQASGAWAREIATAEEDGVAEIRITADFESGYTISQLASVLDELTFVVTAALVATESLATGGDPEKIVAALAGGDLAITWTLESLENGSLRIVAIVKRAGQWACRNRERTLFAVHLVHVVGDIVGWPYMVPLEVAHLAIDAAVIVGTAWVVRRQLRAREQQTGAGGQIQVEVTDQAA